MLSHTQRRVPCPSRVLGERAGRLADIAAADHQAAHDDALSSEIPNSEPGPGLARFFILTAEVLRDNIYTY
jgi:hypothetical protein